MKTKKKVDWKIVCTGLVCITGLEAYALSLGFNGTVLKTVLVAIAGAIGILAIKKPEFMKE